MVSRGASERLQILDEIGLLPGRQIQTELPIVMFDDGSEVRRAAIVEVRRMLQETT